APDPAATRAALAADPAILHDDPIEELFEDQLRCADLVVISKTDLVSAAGLAETEATVRQTARAGVAVMPTTRGGLPAAVLLGLTAAAEADLTGRESHHDLDGEAHDHDDFASFVVSAPAAAS
ncbi:MAG: GTP-binding protein, partial [Bauldia sp.]